MTTKKAETGTRDAAKIGKWVGIGAAGIGSAAIVAALLYARRSNKAPPTPRGPVETQD